MTLVLEGRIMTNTLFLVLNLEAEAFEALKDYTASHNETMEQVMFQALEEWALNRFIRWPEHTE